MTLHYYGFKAVMRDAAGSYNDTLWVFSETQEKARLTCLATWPQIETLEFYKAVADEEN
jgi:hypothetical protein